MEVFSPPPRNVVHLSVEILRKPLASWSGGKDDSPMLVLVKRTVEPDVLEYVFSPYFVGSTFPL